ncbi:helix-turn-helix domain-containing protein [Sphaerisporangium dianthi]|uniref:Helix-turn-helix domain-containing protein n=1 Tax=Sphaerisporangium dianthi TaxID=1436120 RepID=A0ABV9CJ31_9ACTN
MAGPADVEAISSERLGRRLRELRAQSGKSLRAVARELGISPSAVSQIERGLMRPSVSRLIAFVAAVGAPLAAVFDLSDTKEAGTGLGSSSPPGSAEHAHQAGHAGSIGPAGRTGPAGQDGAAGRTGQDGSARSGGPGRAVQPAGRDGASPADGQDGAGAAAGDPGPRGDGAAEAGTSFTVRRAGEVAPILLGGGVAFRRLSPEPTPGVDFFESTYPPGAASTAHGEFHEHDGYEVGTVVAGELTVEFATEVVTLSAGDSITFPASRPHVIGNRSDTTTAIATWLIVHR